MGCLQGISDDGEALARDSAPREILGEWRRYGDDRVEAPQPPYLHPLVESVLPTAADESVHCADNRYPALPGHTGVQDVTAIPVRVDDVGTKGRAQSSELTEFPPVGAGGGNDGMYVCASITQNSEVRVSRVRDGGGNVNVMAQVGVAHRQPVNHLLESANARWRERMQNREWTGSGFIVAGCRAARYTHLAAYPRNVNNDESSSTCSAMRPPMEIDELAAGDGAFGTCAVASPTIPAPITATSNPFAMTLQW